MNVFKIFSEKTDKRVTGGVMRGIGYGAIAVMVATQFMSEDILVFLPVAMLFVGGGMLLESIAKRERTTHETQQQMCCECEENTVRPLKSRVRSHIDAELGIRAVEDRYGDDWYGRNPNWVADNNASVSSQTEK